MKFATTSCKQIKQDLCLLAGRDLTDRDRIEAVRRHVATCPSCRTKYRNLRDGIKVLAANSSVAAVGASSLHADGGTWVAPERSLWPDLAERLPSQTSSTTLPTWSKKWPPIVAAVAACGLFAFLLSGPFTSDMPTAATDQAEVKPAEPNRSLSKDRQMPARSPGFFEVDLGR